MDRALFGPTFASTVIVTVLGAGLIAGPRPTGAPEPDPGTTSAPAPAPAPGAPSAPTTPPPGVAPQPGTPSEPAAPPEQAAPVEPPAPVRSAPLQVRIGSIAVDAPVVPVGLEADGAMEIPERVAEIGWYDPDGLGVVPGATGTAVLAGHVDSRSQGRGALYDLRDLRVGDPIELDLADGTTQRWRVSEVIQYPKDVLPLEEIFTWAGPARLAMITCGGEFDRTARSYTDNIVVYAVPLEGAPTV